MPPIQDDAGSPDLKDPITGQLNYIVEITAKIVWQRITYLEPVGSKFGLSYPVLIWAKNNSIGEASYECGPV